MPRLALVASLGWLLAGSAQAAPQDYKDKLPANVLGMTVKSVRQDGDRLIAFYGETVGRATVTVSPSPEADPGGASAASTGATPSAQRALIQLLDLNLATGTKALGEGYATSTARLDGLKVDQTTALCGLIERSQAEDAIAPGRERMFLLDRLCASQIRQEVVTVHVTTPMTEAMRKKVMSDQLGFSGIVIKVLSEAAKR